MAKKRRHFSGDFKARVALAALRGDRTGAQIASDFGVCAMQVSKWKRELLERAPGAMEDQRAKPREPTEGYEEKIDELHRQIGEVTVERDWLKKKVREVGGK